MKKAFVKLFISAVLFLPAGFSAALPGDDPVLKAMGDEMSRNMAKLKMDDLQKPYFTSYAVTGGTSVFIRGIFGALSESSEQPFREAHVQVRVGDYSFDSMNFVGREGNYRPLSDGLSFEDNYDNIRFELWDLTDQAYKQALERFSQKKAYKETKNITEQFDDLSREARAETIKDLKLDSLDRPAWEGRIRDLSGLFKGYPLIQKSNVNIRFASGTDYYLNSENTAYRIPGTSIVFNIYALTQAKDGAAIERDRDDIYASVKDIPSFEGLTKEVRDFADGTERMVQSSTMDAYIGPVVFEDQAAAEFFNDFLVRNVSHPRSLWVENDSDRWNYQAGEFASRLGMRVTAPFLSVSDDPLMETFMGVSLLGYYPADDEGVPAQKVDLIKKGKLVNLLMSRAPIREFRNSNGHGRGNYSFPEGAPGNLFVTPEKSVQKPELKKRLLEMCKELDLDYGIIIREMPSVYQPLLAWKVYVRDGREEPVHGIEFTGFSTRALRDVTAASREMYIYNYYYNGIPATIIAPSILVQEMEIKKTEEKPDKFPYLPHPYFDKR